MSYQRRSNGFEPAGRIRPDELGLSRKRARALLLAVAWRRVAGEALSARAEARRLSRGVLEVETGDPGLAATLRSTLPDLAGRMAADFPALGLRKCRVIETGRAEARSRPVEVRRPEPPGQG